jgi:hypothetical protein
MGDTNVRLDGPVGPPAKMLEERHVGRLDMGGHDPAAALAGRRNGEANQRYAEREASKRRKHGEAITLPPLIVGVEREEANRSGRLVITVRHDLQRGERLSRPLM